MRAHELVLVALGSPGVGAFLISPTTGCCYGNTRMAALDFSASPVNSAETLKRTTDLSLAGAGSKKKLALLGSTVRPRKGYSRRGKARFSWDIGTYLFHMNFDGGLSHGYIAY